jgi:hypothetical protein
LSKSQVLNIVEAVLDNLADNPAIVSRMVTGKPAIQAGVAGILAGFAEQELDNFSSATAVKIAIRGLKAATESWEMLEHLSGAEGTDILALTAVIDTVFAGLSGGNKKALWRLTQSHVLVAIFNSAFAKLTDYGVTKDSLGKLKAALDEIRTNLETGGRFLIEAFANDLESRLAA